MEVLNQTQSAIALPRVLSQKFTFWSFVSMVLLVFVHAYNLEMRYLQPWTTPEEALTFSTFTEYWLANGIFRFRIPMLFIISGFLFAMGDNRVSHGARVKKRVKTLFVPYALWSAIALLLTFLLEMIPAVREMIIQSHVIQIDETRMLVHEYTWPEVAGRWFFSPVAYQLWFIRALLVYNIAYPWIRWCVLHPVAQKIFFTLAFLLWLATAGFVFVEGEGLLFFSLGVWMQKRNFSIAQPTKLLNPVVWGVVFIVLSLMKTFLAFKGSEWIGDSVFPVITILHKLVVVSGLIACWYGLDRFVRFFMNQKWFVWASAFSFFIYALHAPFVAMPIDAVLNVFRPLPGSELISFFVLPTATIVVCIGAGALLRAVSPTVYRTLTGGRGMGRPSAD